jgi:hypothetical protein
LNSWLLKGDMTVPTRGRPDNAERPDYKIALMRALLLHSSPRGCDRPVRWARKKTAVVDFYAHQSAIGLSYWRTSEICVELWRPQLILNFVPIRPDPQAVETVRASRRVEELGMIPRGTIREQTYLFQLETIRTQHDSPTSNHIQFCRNRFSAVCNLEPIPFVVPIGVLTDPRRDLIRIAEISALIKKIRGFIMRESTIYILAKDGRHLAIPSKPGVRSLYAVHRNSKMDALAEQKAFERRVVRKIDWHIMPW